MQLITRDYETYWAKDFTLSDMSTSSYVFDRRFEVILVSVKINGGKTAYMEEPQWRQFVQSVDWSKCAILGHHNHFDGLIDAHHYGMRPGFWLDTLSMSRAITGPQHKHSLEVLAKRWGVGEKGKEILFTQGMHRADFSPDAFARYGVYSVGDSDLTYGIFQKMLATGFPHSELELIDTTIRMFTEPKFILDEPMMHEYYADEVRRKDEFMAKVSERYAGLTQGEEFVKWLGSSEKFAKLLIAEEVEPPTKQGKNGVIYAFAKSDPGMQELLEHPDDTIRFLAEARVSTKSTLNVSRTERMLQLGAGGRPMPVYHNYYGAHTGRSSGGDKVNFSNFERVSRTDPRKGMIRKALRAPRGHKVVVVDSGQIEARFNAWLAGYDKLVRDFATGADVYSRFATDAFGRPVNRKLKEDEIPGHIGKCMVLGLGYGMGWYKFAGEMLKGMNGGPRVQFTDADIAKLSIDPSPFLGNPSNIERVMTMPSRLQLKDRLIHCTVAKHFVDVYRAKNKPIKQLWELHDKILQWMFEGREQSFHYLGLLQLEKEGVRLPNRLKLWYRGLTKDEDGFHYFDGRTTKKAYGGSVTENFVQALTRIIVMDQSTMIKKAGIPIVTWSYDEVVTIVPDARAEECLEQMLEIFKIAPPWAPGLPLAAEGGIGETYGEAKH